MIRCPACRADNAGGPSCRRCKADLSLLFALEARREALLGQARLEGAAARWQEALATAAEADALRQDGASLRLVAVAALMCRDFHQAWRCYLGCKAAPAERT
jgi:hypothetical protein